MPFVPRSNRSRRRRSRRHRGGGVMVLAILTILSGGMGWFVAGHIFSLGRLFTGPKSLNGPLQPGRPQNGGAAPNIDANAVLSPQVVVPEPKVPISASSGYLSPVRSPLPFTDVANTYWAKPYIDALTARDVLNGLPDGTFAPEQPLSRAELAAQVAKAFAVPERHHSKTFTDLPSDYWATEPINKAVATGFMTGYPAGDLRPEQTVSRLQVLVALATGLSLPPSPTARQDLQQYQDWQTIPPWGRGQVAAAMQAGIIKAAPDSDLKLRPNDPATRAEVAALVYATLVYLGQAEALP